MKPRAGAAIVSKLLCYPCFFHSFFFILLVDCLPPISRQTKKRRRERRRTTVPFFLSLVSRRLSQTYKSNLCEQIATEIPWRFQVLFLFLLLFFFFFSCFYSTHLCLCLFYTTPTDVHSRVHAFLPSCRVFSLGSRDVSGKKQGFCSAFLILNSFRTSNISDKNQ